MNDQVPMASAKRSEADEQPGNRSARFNIVAADVRRRRFGQLSAGNPPPHVGGYGEETSSTSHPARSGPLRLNPLSPDDVRPNRNSNFVAFSVRLGNILADYACYTAA